MRRASLANNEWERFADAPEYIWELSRRSCPISLERLFATPNAQSDRRANIRPLSIMMNDVVNNISYLATLPAWREEGNGEANWAHDDTMVVSARV